MELHIYDPVLPAPTPATQIHITNNAPVDFGTVEPDKGHSIKDTSL